MSLLVLHDFVIVTLDVVRCTVVLHVWQNASELVVLHSNTMHRFYWLYLELESCCCHNLRLTQ